MKPAWPNMEFAINSEAGCALFIYATALFSLKKRHQTQTTVIPAQAQIQCPSLLSAPLDFRLRVDDKFS